MSDSDVAEIHHPSRPVIGADSDALDITVRYQLLNHLTPNATSHPDHGFATT